MPRRCSVCFNPDCETVNELLLAGIAQLLIAERFNLSPHAVHRHNRDHLHLPMAKAAEKHLVTRMPAKQRLERAQNAIELAHGSDLLAQMGKLVDDAERIKQGAEERLDLRTALQAVRELCRLVELAAKLRGEMASGTKSQTSVQLNADSEWGPCPWTIEQINGIVAGSSELQRFRALTIGTDWCAETPFDPEDFEWLWTSIEQRLATKNRLLSDGSQPAASDDLNAEEGKIRKS